VSEAVAVQEGEGCARLRLRVKAGARRERFLGAHGGALKLEVGAPPERGKANAAVVRLLAGELGLPRTEVEIAAGATSRDKTVVFTGADAADIVARFERAGVPARVAMADRNKLAGKGS